jgi:Tol biopolymer transport system component
MVCLNGFSASAVLLPQSTIMKICKPFLFSIIVILVTHCTLKEMKVKPGIFDDNTDIGSVRIKGEATYDPATEIYHVTGSGTNMWFGRDEFHFVWNKMSGNIILNALIEFNGRGVDPHRKAGLIIRKNLNADSPYVSAAYHGDGLVSMQYRAGHDTNTYEFKAGEDSLPVLQITAHNGIVSVQAAALTYPLQEIGQLKADFTMDEYYAGLFVCSHNPEVIEEVTFKNLRITIPAADDFVPYTDYIGARLEIFDTETGLRKTVFESELPIEAPNWSRDGKHFIVNAGGKIYKIPAEGGKETVINTDFAQSNNNDHGLSPDGSLLAISHHLKELPAGKNSIIFTLPSNGGTPSQITSNGPSYWHGWSPDGKYLIYTANRDDEWAICRIPATGGDEVRLSGTGALDDGSEYSPDGAHIWFNSNRTGTMEIWRMNADGSVPVQITDDEYQNWFAHESPDGNKLVFLSYLSDIDPYDHPYYKHVMLRLLRIQDGQVRGRPEVIAYIYGGQGTINVHSWSPDGQKFAFVSNTGMIQE